MIKKNIRLSEAGMSMVQVLVAMGLAGILTMVLTTITTNAMKGQKSVENKFEIQTASLAIQSLLAQKDACTQTLNNGGVYNFSSGPKALTQIVDASDNPVYVVGSAQSYPNNQGIFQVSAIEVLSDGGGANTRVQVDFEIIKPNHQGPRNIRRQFSVAPDWNASGDLISCTLLRNDNDEIVENACPTQFQDASGTPLFVIETVNDKSRCVLNNQAKSSQCSSGQIFMGLNVETGEAICKTLPTGCGSNPIVYHSTGDFECLNLSALTCPDGQYLKGVNVDGTPDCRSLIAGGSIDMSTCTGNLSLTIIGSSVSLSCSTCTPICDQQTSFCPGESYPSSNSCGTCNNGTKTVGCCASPGPVYTADADGDGYGDPSSEISGCAGDPGVVTTQGGDCCDNDANVFPGQTQYFPTANSCGNFDYDCSGSDEESIMISGNSYTHTDINTLYYQRPTYSGTNGDVVSYASYNGRNHADTASVFFIAKDNCSLYSARYNGLNHGTYTVFKGSSSLSSPALQACGANYSLCLKSIPGLNSSRHYSVSSTSSCASGDNPYNCFLSGTSAIEPVVMCR